MSWGTFKQKDFTGGENRKLRPEFVAPNQLTYAQNCVLTAENLLETRQGKVKVNTTSLGTGKIISLHRWAKEAGTKYLTAQHGTALYSYGYDGTQFASFGAAVKTGLNAAKLRGVTWKDHLIVGNGVDATFRFDGTTCTNLTGAPKAELFAVHAGRLFCVDADNPNHLRWSGLEDYDSWDALDLIKVRDGDGDFITGISAQPGGLVITKNNSFYVLYGTNRFDFSLVGPKPPVGCISKDALMDEGVLLGNDNWYLFSLNGLEPIAETHTPLLDALTDAQKREVFAVVQPLTKRVLYCLPTQEIVVLDGKRWGVTTWKGLNAACFAVSSAQGDNGAILVGDATNGVVYSLTGTDDDGTDIETLIKTSYLDMGSDQEKIWRYFWPKIDLLDSGDYEVFARYDVDFAKIKGLETFSGTFPDTLDWGSEDWGGPLWGTGVASPDDPYWLHGVRGGYISFETKSNNRIRYKGYETKYRIAGVK